MIRFISAAPLHRAVVLRVVRFLLASFLRQTVFAAEIVPRVQSLVELTISAGGSGCTRAARILPIVTQREVNFFFCERVTVGRYGLPVSDGDGRSTVAVGRTRVAGARRPSKVGVVIGSWR